MAETSGINPLILRPATDSDKAQLLAWRNDPTTRLNSRRQHLLSWAELANAPPGTRRAFFIGEINNEPIGSIRLDYSGSQCEVSWVVAPEQRGKGLGTWLLKRGIETAQASLLVAEIKPDNQASRRIAEAAGFSFAHQHGDLMVWHLRRETSA